MVIVERESFDYEFNDVISMVIDKFDDDVELIQKEEDYAILKFPDCITVVVGRRKDFIIEKFENLDVASGFLYGILI